jgi:hypothetical protein
MVYVSKYSRGILLNFKSILDYLVHISFFFFHLSNISEYNFDDNIEYYGDIENNCVANIKNVKIRSFFPCNSCTHVNQKKVPLKRFLLFDLMGFIWLYYLEYVIYILLGEIVYGCHLLRCLYNTLFPPIV